MESGFGSGAPFAAARPGLLSLAPDRSFAEGGSLCGDPDGQLAVARAIWRSHTKRGCPKSKGPRWGSRAFVEIRIAVVYFRCLTKMFPFRVLNVISGPPPLMLPTVVRSIFTRYFPPLLRESSTTGCDALGDSFTSKSL